ncbi:hypothetical protein MFIFM68171_05059 [Madurella fahalii]|uniref:Apple domain-containing protein n=1 Tax=Madurella fahalii TaxID=1157608 RepID=A0ABQ0GAZ7_9PEZI
MAIFINGIILLLGAIFTLGVDATPAPLGGAFTGLTNHRHLLPLGPDKTGHALRATCTNGVPASTQHPASYAIDNYTVVMPAENWTSYMIRDDWYAEHFVSGPHYMSFTHSSDPYGPFKCQYACNAADNCSAYFAWYEHIGTTDEHFNCVLFDAIVPPSIFIETSGTIAAGAYDRLCD